MCSIDREIRSGEEPMTKASNKGARTKRTKASFVQSDIKLGKVFFHYRVRRCAPEEMIDCLITGETSGTVRCVGGHSSGDSFVDR